MTERKPPEVPFDSWVDRQIDAAAARGEFDDLPGAGKPLAAIDAPYDELWWVRRKMQTEGISVLPPTLALRKEAEDTMAEIERARSEREVRRMVTEINAKIVAALRMPPPGPVLGLRPFDEEEAVARWRAARPEPAAPANPVGTDARRRGSSRWRPWRRRVG
ncbi:DUF1992 domain-containing protein [Embleya sp. MST-111070]|uniref:DnaJ family domain-containing protein n=1 Tax=Embleya sp. MST-111070 TaxID=3398231 RepID=UPI003F73E936